MLSPRCTPEESFSPPAHADLRIRRARLRGSSALHDLIVRDGRIAEILPSAQEPDESVGPVLDVDGRLVVAGLIESHLHLEKAFLLDRAPSEARTLAEAIAITADLKRSFTPADMRERALRVLRITTTQGVTHVRCHVEVDDVLDLSAVETMMALREDVAHVVDLQIVVFPQEGVLRQRRARDLMRAAMRMGADVVGGIPYNDADAGEHLDFVFDLAAEFDAPLDFHIDLSDDPDQRDILEVIRRTTDRQMHGRVTAGHLTSLGSVPADEARGIAGRIAAAGINVVALPVTDLFLNGRGDPERVRRGITPVRILLDEGVNVSVATNNVQNPFTPFGRGRLLDAALLLASLCHMATAADAETLLDMITINPARTIGLTFEGRIAPGSPADLAVFDAVNARTLVNDCHQPWAVMKAGRIVTAEELPS